MLVAGRCNVDDPKFAAARAKGAEILVYLNPIERPDEPVLVARVTRRRSSN